MTRRKKPDPHAVDDASALLADQPPLDRAGLLDDYEHELNRAFRPDAAVPAGAQDKLSTAMRAARRAVLHPKPKEAKP